MWREQNPDNQFNDKCTTCSVFLRSQTANPLCSGEMSSSGIRHQGDRENNKTDYSHQLADDLKLLFERDRTQRPSVEIIPNDGDHWDRESFNCQSCFHCFNPQRTKHLLRKAYSRLLLGLAGYCPFKAPHGCLGGCCPCRARTLKNKRIKC